MYFCNVVGINMPFRSTKILNFTNTSKNYPNFLTTFAHTDPAEELLRLFPYNPETSRLTVWCPVGEYSAGHIARAVEDCDAHLLNLNVLAISDAPDVVTVEIRVGIRNGMSVVRSLARYGYAARLEDIDTQDDIFDDYDSDRLPSGSRNVPSEEFNR